MLLELRTFFLLWGSSKVIVWRTPKGSPKRLKSLQARRFELLSASQLDVSESNSTLNIKSAPPPPPDRRPTYPVCEEMCFLGCFHAFQFRIT